MDNFYILLTGINGSEVNVAVMIDNGTTFTADDQRDEFTLTGDEAAPVLEHLYHGGEQTLYLRDYNTDEWPYAIVANRPVVEVGA